MTTTIDDAGPEIVVVRAIVVTPEDPSESLAPTIAVCPPIGVAVSVHPGVQTLAAAPVALTVSAQPSFLAGLPVPAVQLRTTLAALATQPILPAPALGVTVHVGGHPTGGTEVLDCPPITLQLAMPPVALPVVSPSIGVGVAVSALATDAQLHLTQPSEAEVVATAFPQFIVGVQLKDEDLDYQVVIQYADNPAFSAAITLSVDMGGTDGGVFVTPTLPVPADAYWRARLLQSGGTLLLDWTDAVHFSVNASISTLSAAVTWSADAGLTPAIHLWHFNPPGPALGDTVTAYGQGFPLTPGTLWLGDQQVPVETWQLVAANTTTFAGLIAGPVVDPEHFEVTFTAPDVDPPGGPFAVEA